MTTVSASYSRPQEDIFSLYQEISAVEEELNHSPISKLRLQGNIASIRRLVTDLGASNRKFPEIQSQVRKALSDLRKTSESYLQAKVTLLSMQGSARLSFRERLLGKDISFEETPFPEEPIHAPSCEKPGKGIAYEGLKIGAPLVVEALEHTRVGTVVKYIQTIVKTWINAEKDGIDEACSNLIAGKILSKLCGGSVMGSSELAVFVAENEKELLAAADKLPQNFSEPAIREHLFSLEGPTPEGAKLLGELLIGVIAPIGRAFKSVTQQISHDVSQVMKAVGEHGEGAQADKAYGAIFAHIVDKR